MKPAVPSRSVTRSPAGIPSPPGLTSRLRVTGSLSVTEHDLFGLFGRDRSRRLRCSAALQRVPAEAGALDARRELAHAGERGELAELVASARRRSASVRRSCNSAANSPRPARASCPSRPRSSARPRPPRSRSRCPRSARSVDRSPSSFSARTASAGRRTAGCRRRRVRRLVERGRNSADGGCDRGSRRDRVSCQVHQSQSISGRGARCAATSGRCRRGCCTGERGARGRRHAEALHHRHRAVVAGADGDAFVIEDGAEVVRVDAIEREGDDRRLVGRGADEAQAGNARCSCVVA